MVTPQHLEALVRQIVEGMAPAPEKRVVQDEHYPWGVNSEVRKAVDQIEKELKGQLEYALNPEP